MAKFLTAAKKFLTGKEEGASMVEYGLLVALIAVICIVAVTLLGGNLSSTFNKIAAAI